MLENFRQRREDQFGHVAGLGAAHGFDQRHHVGGGHVARRPVAQLGADDTLDMLPALLHRAGGQRREHLRHVVGCQLPEALGGR
jgi:hypothetical protein